MLKRTQIKTFEILMKIKHQLLANYEFIKPKKSCKST